MKLSHTKAKKKILETKLRALFLFTYINKLTTLKINLSGFIFTGKINAPGMAVIDSGKPASLTQVLPLSGWFSESNVVLCVSASEAAYLRGLNKQVYLHQYLEFLPLRPVYVLTLF